MSNALLITGGTGTLGTALLGSPWNGPIRVVSRDEQKQDALKPHFENKGVRWILGDVRDPEKLRMALIGVSTVIHCAALKIVPQGSYNPDEMIKTNIIGTMNVIREAIHAGVERVIVTTTDKGVEPTTLYGATKLCAERLAQQSNMWSSTNVSVVRLGNIEASRGSLTAWMDKLIAEGKSVPITDKDMTRFWITRQAAVHFIWLALDKMEGGEIFVPKLPARKVMDMLPVEAKYHVIGRRPDERCYEPLVGYEELKHTDEFENHFVIKPWPYQGNTRRTHAYRSDITTPGHSDDHGESGL